MTPALRSISPLLQVRSLSACVEFHVKTPGFALELHGEDRFAMDVEASACLS